jgi:hypothetical protein
MRHKKNYLVAGMMILLALPLELRQAQLGQDVHGRGGYLYRQCVQLRGAEPEDGS